VVRVERPHRNQRKSEGKAYHKVKVSGQQGLGLGGQRVAKVLTKVKEECRESVPKKCSQGPGKWSVRSR
jgi:hypothetical protein